MRKLITLILIAAALWSGYWFVGKTAKKEVIETWLQSQKDAGWSVSYDDFSMVGFPNRFDSRFTKLTLKDPLSGLGWKAPFFNILALSYQPNHIIAIFPPNQSLDNGREEIEILSQDMVASVTFEPDTLLAVNETRVRTSDLALNGGTGWHLRADKLDLSTRQKPEIEFAHDVFFDAENITPTQAFRSGLDPKGRLPATIEKLLFDIVLDFNAPWNRVAIESGAPEVEKITFNQMNAVWGELGLVASGDLDVLPNGTVNGTLDLKIGNWREVLALFVTSGILTEDFAATIARGLDAITAGTDDPTILEIPLILSDGLMSLGPIKLGTAPSFVR